MSFSHDGVLDSCVIWQSETNQGKARCLYIGSHEGSWLNWKETRRGFDQVKHVSSRGLQTNGHGNRNLMKKMGNTLLISILRGLFSVVYSMRARLWYIRMYCDTLFWAMIFVDFCGMLWALKILCFSLWNSPFTPGRNLLSKELECGHEESRRNVLLEWPGSLSLWPGHRTRVWSFKGFEISSRNYGGPAVLRR